MNTTGKEGHTAQTLARKLGAVRRAYRALQGSYNARERYAVINAQRAHAARNELSEARVTHHEAMAALQQRMERKGARIAELEDAARQWWRSPLMFALGMALASLAWFLGGQ